MLAQGAEWGRDLTLADSDRQSVWPFRIPAEEACAVPRGRLGERSEGWARRPYLEATERDRIFDYHSCIAGPLAAQIENEHRLALHNFRRGLQLARTQQLHDS